MTISSEQHPDDFAKLVAFEDEADAALAAMPLARLPARALLTGIHFFLYSTRHAVLFDRPELPGVADTVATRLSYLLPIAVRCPAEPFGGDAADALRAFTDCDPEGRQLRELLSYLHFSEFMPEAHKAYYRVTATEEGFELAHRDANFAEAQARDILLSELALVFPLPSENALEPILRDIVDQLPEFDWALLGPLLAKKIERLLFNLAEPHLVTAEAMKRIFGFGYSEFYRIRAALLAYAEFALEVSMVLGAQSCREQGGAGISTEALEWVSVNHEADWFTGLIAGLSGTDLASVERFLAHYTIDFRVSPVRHHGGDGLFPPFARFAQSFVFAPIHVLSTLHLRNAVFAFSGMDRKTFANHVANELEPVLVSQAVSIFRHSHDWTLKPNIDYDGGEIDLVVAGPTGPVLLLEAKGPLPPQGARLTERLAGRIREGITQIEKLRDLPVGEREALISTAIGRPVVDADLRYGLLARSCFGAVEAFEDANGIVRLTLPLLSIVLGEMRGAREPADVALFLARLAEIEARFYRDAAPHWEDGTLTLADRTLTVPTLQFDHSLVDMVRALAWEYSVIADESRSRSVGPSSGERP